VKFWLDAQLPPALARYLTGSFGVEAEVVRNLGLREAADREIFEAARRAGSIVITKDGDFVELARRLGSPPQVVWVTCGNASNERLIQVFAATFADARELLAGGAPIVEISDAPAGA
jgi:predicted nuclease of predicted toxin-antitoxin system